MSVRRTQTEQRKLRFSRNWRRIIQGETHISSAKQETREGDLKAVVASFRPQIKSVAVKERSQWSRKRNFAQFYFVSAVVAVCQQVSCKQQPGPGFGRFTVTQPAGWRSDEDSHLQGREFDSLRRSSSPVPAVRTSMLKNVLRWF